MVFLRVVTHPLVTNHKSRQKSLLEFWNTFLLYFHISKFQAWYDKIYPNFPGAELCTSDTDSFLFSIESENLYEDLKKIENFWDFSTLPKDHPHYDPSTMNKLGYFKIETSGDRIYSCAGMFFQTSDKKTRVMEKTRQNNTNKNIYLFQPVGLKYIVQILYRGIFGRNTKKEKYQNV